MASYTGEAHNPCGSGHKTGCLSSFILGLTTAQGSGRATGPQSVLEASNTAPKIIKGTISWWNSINQLLYPGSQATEEALLCSLVFLLISDGSTKTRLVFLSQDLPESRRWEFTDLQSKLDCKNLSPVPISLSTLPLWPTLSNPVATRGYHGQELMEGLGARRPQP